MESQLDLSGALALLGAMAALAALPSISVLTVISRSVAGGFTHGAAAALGIVAGDLMFVAIAIFGLALLAETLGGLFMAVQLLGAAYLIALGLRLWRAQSANIAPARAERSTRLTSFNAGLLLTLADQKAILFYLGFFPAFLDLQRLSRADAVLIVMITVVAVGGVKLLYALAAARGSVMLDGGAVRGLNRLAAAVLASAGIALLLRTLA